MRPHELLALALLCAAAVAQADPSDYGKVDTFQPGKKYNCVPTADHKGWDCKVTGAAEIPAASAPAAAATPEPPPATQAPPAAESAAHAGALPDYLTAAGSNGAMQPMPAAPAAMPPARPRVPGPQVPAKTPAPPTAASPAPVVQPAPAAVAPPPAPAPRAPTRADATDDFLALPAGAYVIELAHAASETDLVAPNPACGKVYKLHLRQNGTDVWLLVCGPYDSLQAARAARDEIAAQGVAPGWPRRIGPLQAEVERVRN